MQSRDSVIGWLQESREELERLRQEWSEASATGRGRSLSTIGNQMFEASITIEVLKRVLEDEDVGSR